MKLVAVQEMIQQFEEGTYPKEKWTHYSHFVMAFWYCYHQPLRTAIRSIKEGIKKYNISVGGKNTDDAGYHETITVFYISQIMQYLAHGDESAELEDLLAQLDHQPFLAKEYPYKFYSKETLMSKEARKKWVAPDKTMASLLNAVSD